MKLDYATTIKAAINGRQPLPVREHRFHPDRKWAFDFAWPEDKVALEVEGLTQEGGRHQRIQGYEEDCEKYDQAALLGWTVIRCSPNQLHRNPFRYMEMVYQLRRRNQNTPHEPVPTGDIPPLPLPKKRPKRPKRHDIPRR